MTTTPNAADSSITFAMSPPHPRKLFVNLPIRDLAQSMTFFSKLGFTFNKQFTNEKATAMLVGEDAYVMLLTQPMFKEFSRRPIGDPAATTTGIFSIAAESRAEVDELVKIAVAAGGAHAADPQDHGFMYGWSFYDLDGHHWEVFWMDPATVQQ
jgi:predicted lactoylglutathione lyase